MRIERAISILSSNPSIVEVEGKVVSATNYLEDLRKFQARGYSHVCEVCGRAYYKGEGPEFCSVACIDEYIKGGNR